MAMRAFDSSGAASPEARDLKKKIRRLLRGLRRPHVLASNPAVQTLQGAYSATTAYDAVVAFISDTFDARTVRGRRLLELLRLTDMQEGDLPTESVAHQMNLSPRQYFRYRAEAISALAERFNALMTRRFWAMRAAQKLSTLLADVDPAAAIDVLESSHDFNLQRLNATLAVGEPVEPKELAHWSPTQMVIGMMRLSVDRFAKGERPGAEAILKSARSSPGFASQPARFESLVADYIEALLYANADEAARIADQARAAANGEEQRARAMLMQLETAVRRGHTEFAETELGVLEPLVVGLGGIRELSDFASINAAVAFLRCDWTIAADTLRPAALALRHRPADYIKLLTTANRIRLASGLDLKLPDPADASPSNMTFRILFHRFTLHRLAKTPNAELLADDVDRAEATGIQILAAYGLASQALLGAGDAVARLIRAWARLATVDDIFVAHDAFVLGKHPYHDYEAILLSDRFISEFLRVMLGRHPDHALLAQGNGGARWWKNSLISALEIRRDPQRGYAVHDGFADRIDPLARDAARWLSVLLPFERRPVFSAALQDLISQASPA